MTNKLKVGKTYTLWQEIHGTFSSGNAGIYLQIGESKEGENTQYYGALTSNKTFTVKEGYTYYVQIQTNTVENTGTLVNYKNRYMIYEGTEDKEFQLYGAMPSPEYPSQIRNVGDNVNILENTATSQTINGIDFTVNEDGTILVNGTATTDAQLVIQTPKLFGKGNYILDDFVNGSSTTYFSRIYENNTWDTIAQTINGKSSFVLAENKNIRVVIIIKSGITVDNVIFKPIITKDIAPISYTPFGYGSADIKVQNKNVLYIQDGSITEYGLTLTVKNGIITTSGTLTDNNTFFYKLNKTMILKKGTYTIWNGSNITYPYVALRKGTTQYIVQKYIDNGITIFTTDKDIEIDEISFWIKPENYETYRQFNPMLLKGIYTKDMIREFVKHEEQTLHFQLAKVLHKEDYLADDGIHYKRKTIIFDGTEAWFKSSTALVNRFGLTTSKVNNFKGINSDNTLCTHFKYDERNRITINAYHFLNSNALYFDTDMENVTTLEEWKSYLAEQYANGTPVTLEYGLVEEIVEAYTSEQQEAYNKLKELYSYEDVTHITCENDINCNFNVEYFKDYNILRQNDKQELQAQIDEIKASLVSEVSE